MSKSSRYIIFTVLSFAFAFEASAQNQARPNNYGQWLMYFGDNKINSKLGVHSELQLRNYFIKETFAQTLIRVGMNYYVDPNIMVTTGYGFFYTSPTVGNEAGISVLEHRIWQQLLLRHRTRAVFMDHRYRLEQRFISAENTNTSIFENRIRYRFNAIFPLYTISPNLRHLFLASYNEIFINLGREASGEIFDRNRLYFSVGYQVSPKLNFQLGYLNQLIAVPGADAATINHNLQISVMYNIDDVFTQIFNR